MTQEEKATREAEEVKETEAEVEETEVEETETSDDETTEEESKDTSDEESKQLEAELQRERKAREDAEKASADLAFKLREKKRKQEEVVEQDEQDEDRPLTAKDLAAILAREREANRKEMLTAEADRIASKWSTNDTQKQLILEVHKNRSFPAHLSLEEQIEEAYIITNKRKLLGENSELKRALKGKSNASKDVATTHHDALTGNQPKMASADAQEMARVGYQWNAKKRRYEKRLSNGDALVFDPKTKQNRVEKKA